MIWRYDIKPHGLLCYMYAPSNTKIHILVLQRYEKIGNRGILSRWSVADASFGGNRRLVVSRITLSCGPR